MAIRRIGQILVDLGYMEEEQIEVILAEQQHHPGELFGKIAYDMNLVTQEQLVEALSEQMGLPIIELGDFDIAPEVIEQVTDQMAQMYLVIPVKFDGFCLTVATCDPQNLAIQDEMRTLLGHDIELVIATEAEIEKGLDKYYADATASISGIIDELEEDKDLKAKVEAISNASGPIDISSVGELVDSAPVRKLLNMVLLMAIKEHASDIHFEPFEDEFRIRIKADGVLYEMVPPPRHLAFAITTRIKVMSDLDIAERRLPQDGRIELTVGGHPVDLRVSVMPTMFGESVVMRILDRSVVSLDLGKIGMEDELLAVFRKVIDMPNGIVLVTGPTGSGKTTTLYSALSELNDVKDKLITTEDPVEYDIEGIVQIPIDSDIGVTFAACLRSILRQDPDKILVGEIRDTETAEIAVQASLTGHQVFSTLHTNDAPSTITRLKDMGVPVFLITATVEAILAQRLLRRVCSLCREEVAASDDVLQELDLDPNNPEDRKFYRGKGCDNCNNTGYKGRVGVFELMIVNDEIRELVMQNASTDELREAGERNGMETLRKTGIRLARSGTTTIEEVLRETVVDG